MDKQLLKALDNIGVGLEALVEALQKSGEAKSNVGEAVQSGDFGKSLEQISVEIQSIKTDTQEILKNQKTLIALAKKKETEKKTGDPKDPITDAGDPKKTGALKKGLATILLIAVAVLAIGMAFKIVGKVNIMSVIALGIGIVLVAVAFERVAKIRNAAGGPLSIKEAMIASLVMVTMSLAAMISSKFLSNISPISIKQALTAGMIALLFVLVAPAIGKLISSLMMSTEVEFKGNKIKTQKLDMGAFMAALVMVPLLMITSSIGIMLSSKILSMVVPLKISQLITVTLIALMFAVVAKGIAGLITAFTTSTEAKGKGFGFKTQSIGMGKLAAVVLMLPLVMVAIAAGIALSSRVLQMVKPIGFMQAITAILIAAMFAVVSMGIGKLINSLGKFALAAIIVLPLAMAAIALGISVSAEIFARFKGSFDKLGWVTIFKILLLGVAIGAITFVMSYAIKNLKKLDLKTVILLPLLLTLISLAVAASAYIFGQDKVIQSLQKITFMTIFKIALIGIAMAIVTIIAAFAIKIMGNINLKKVILLPILFTLISLAVAVSSWIFAKFSKSFNKLTFSTIFRIIFFGIAIAIVAIAMAFAIKIVTKLVKPVDALKGGLVIVILAGVIALTSLILSLGKYNKYPSLKWGLGVGLALTAFGVGALALGSAVFGPQALVFLAGLAAILVVSAVIVGTSMILNAGKYNKYPKLGWTVAVAASLGAFALGAIALGLNVINPFFWVGLPMILTVAETITDVAKILGKGKYDANFGQWAMGVLALYGAFVPIILILGAVGVAAAVMGFFGGPNPFETGRTMLADIAWSIVDVSKILSKGKYTGGPTKEWAEGVAIAIGAFGQVYQMLVNNAVMEAFGMGGVGPDDFARAIKVVAKGIVVAAGEFAKHKTAFENGPPLKWAKGVGTAIGAFAPVFVALNENTGWFTSGEDVVGQMVMGIIAITRGIISAAEILASNTAPFESYPSKKWGKGVGEALKAFEPVFKNMAEGSGWFTSGEEVVDGMVYGIRAIAGALSDAAFAFSFVPPEMWKSYPSHSWAKGVGSGVQGFMDLFDVMDERGYSAGFFSLKAALLQDGVWSMASTARILYKNRKYFTVKLDPNFIKNISRNILGFADLALKLDKMLVSEKTVTTEASVGFGLAKVSLSKTVKVRKDLSLPKDIAIQMANVAQILWHNKKFFSYSLPSEWVTNLSKNLLRYFFLQKQLESLSGESILKSALMIGLTAVNPLLGLGFAGASALMESRSDDTVAKAAKKLVKVAWIMYSGRKAFDMKIDPNFMAKVGKNLIDFAYVVKKIAEIERSNSGGNFLRDLIGNDPISSYSKKMIKLAKGYDAMANALLKLGRAIKILKLKDLKELAKITSEVSTGRYDPEKRISPVKTKELFAPKKVVSESRSKDYTAKFEDLIAEMRVAVRLLSGIKADSKNINRYLAELGNDPKEAEGDSGVRRDKWGRPSTSKWFGFNEKTKKYE